MQPLRLLTAATPNGHKPQIFIEELRAAYGPEALEVEYKWIDFSKNEQKEDWFLKINPNGRIPALVDPNRGNFAVFESAAIVLYLEKYYDPKHLFSWSDSKEEEANHRFEALSWIMWQQGGLGPMLGQSNHFTRYAPEKIPYGIKRYQDEGKRLLNTLDDHLAGRHDGVKKDYIVGNRYSIADITCWPWSLISPWSGVQSKDLGPDVKAWIDRIWNRDAVQKGIHKPEHNSFYDKLRDPDFETKYGDEAAKRAAEASKWIMAGNKDEDDKQQSKSKV